MLVSHQENWFPENKSYTNYDDGDMIAMVIMTMMLSIMLITITKIAAVMIMKSMMIKMILMVIMVRTMLIRQWTLILLYIYTRRVFRFLQSFCYSFWNLKFNCSWDLQWKQFFKNVLKLFRSYSIFLEGRWHNGIETWIFSEWERLL